MPGIHKACYSNILFLSLNVVERLTGVKIGQMEWLTDAVVKPKTTLVALPKEGAPQILSCLPRHIFILRCACIYFKTTTYDYMLFQPCYESIYEFIKKNLTVIAGVALGIGLAEVSIPE